jgi:signal transduction histidine kinase
MDERRIALMSLRAPARKGAHRWASTNSSQEEAGAVHIARDITDRENAEKVLLNALGEVESKSRELDDAYRELRESQKRALQQEKMASIGQLAAGVAHEINNPMGFITSNLRSLQKYMTRIREFTKVQSEVIETLARTRGADGDSALRDAAESRRSLKIDYVFEDAGSLLKESLEGVHRVTRIVRDLKDFSRADEAARVPTDINELLEGVINVVWNELKYKASLSRHFEALPQIRCNPSQLSRVFLNILINAAQAIIESGEITVKTRVDKGHIEVTVSDTGLGIPSDHIGRVFEPFFTTRGIGKGAGLGLSIAHDIVKTHKGEISVSSEVGKGTTCVVRLPVEAADRIEAPRPSGPVGVSRD